MPDLDLNASSILAASVRGRAAMYLDTSGATPVERVLTGDAVGPNVNAIITPGPAGGNIVTDADVAVGVGATVSLGTPAASSRRMTIQVSTAAGALIRIRAVGGAAGSGVLLTYLASVTYDEAVERCEAENVGAVAATVAVQYETA